MKILLVVYDNDSHISYFPLGTAYIASVCRNAGHEVRIYNQDVYHWPESHLLEMLNKERFDVVGVGVIAGYYQYRKFCLLLFFIWSKACSFRNRRKNSYVWNL